MFNHRIRILSSLLIAFIIINLYGRLSKTPFISPIQAENIKNLLSNIKFNPNSLVKFFTIKFDSKEPELVSRLDKPNNSFIFPTVNQITSPPTITPKIGSGNPTPTIRLYPTNKIVPTTKPVATAIPKPTNTPKPTKVPPLPPITSDTRPGTSLEEIFQEVNKRACIPVPLLRAFQTQESGPFYNYNNSASITKIYNAYGWWKTGAGDPCFGLGYHSQTGVVPQDSVKAGTSCQNAVQPNAYDQGIMGVLQISQFEQDRTRKYTTPILPKNIDRRVLFDNALIFAYATRARVGTPPKNCDDWPADVIKVAAEKHYGACTDNYCANILKYYNQYK
ncbi:MAG: hypothetical protein AAB441_01645 [Patescibacteria group bacterium]